MNVISEKYETDDGMVFDSKPAALAHTRLIQAKAHYEDARREYATLLAETQKTADGYPFNLNSMGFYYRITHGFSALPRLAQVSFYPYHVDLDDNDVTVIRHKETTPSRDQVWRTYRISDLYYRKENAEKALLIAQKERLDTLEVEHAEYAQSLAHPDDGQ